MAKSSEVNSASEATLVFTVSAADSAETAAVGAMRSAGAEDAAVLPQADRVSMRHSPREMDLVWCKKIPSFEKLMS